MGFAERDRFELSGAELEEWLEDPSGGKDILLRNLGGDYKGESDDTHKDVESDVPTQESDDEQIALFDAGELVPKLPTGNGNQGLVSTVNPFRVEKVLNTNGISEEIALDASIDHIVLGLGFEERTLESVRRIAQFLNKVSALTVRYTEHGKTSEIEKLLRGVAIDRRMLEYEETIGEGFPFLEGSVLIDITGLAKPVIFHAIRNELRKKRQVWICHTEAEQYYPLDSDLRPILAAQARRDSHALLDQVSGMLTGEEGPYMAKNLLPSDSDETRRRVLCAASSAKHERLLSLLDDRDYESARTNCAQE